MATAPEQKLTPRNQMMLDQINSAYEALVAAGAQETPRMAERIFVGIWLPFFAGDEKRQYDVTLQHWLNFTQNPYRSVHVVDTQGRVLFEVPALYDRSAVNPQADTSALPSIAHVVESASQYANIHPTQGERYLDAELTRRALTMRVPATVLSNLETWNAIFMRYGRPPLVAAEKLPTAALAEPKDGGLSYDVDPL